jgi:hypothetical protein
VKAAGEAAAAAAFCGFGCVMSAERGIQMVFIGTKSYQHQAATTVSEAHSTYILLVSFANGSFAGMALVAKSL